MHVSIHTQTPRLTLLSILEIKEKGPAPKYRKLVSQDEEEEGWYIGNKDRYHAQEEMPSLISLNF